MLGKKRQEDRDLKQAKQKSTRSYLKNMPGIVTDTCNSSYSGGGNRRIVVGEGPAWAKLARSYLERKLKFSKDWTCGSSGRVAA
jgi:hypothetical protein